MSKIQIAADTPKKLIDLFKQIDLSKVPESEHDDIISKLKHVASQHLPRRNGKVKAKVIDLPGCPQRLATVVSQFDFNAISKTRQNLGFSFIKGWLDKKGLLK